MRAREGLGKDEDDDDNDDDDDDDSCVDKYCCQRSDRQLADTFVP